MAVDLHIIPRAGKWAVRAGDSQHDDSLHESQEQALQEAQNQALQSGGSVRIYAEDGSVLEQHTLPQQSGPNRQPGGAGPG